jgi:hypothetical protein
MSLPDAGFFYLVATRLLAGMRMVAMPVAVLQRDLHSGTGALGYRAAQRNDQRFDVGGMTTFMLPREGIRP